MIDSDISDDEVSFEVPDQDTVLLNRGHYTTVRVNLYGATIVSWTILHQEQLFTSMRAVYNNKKIIQGGISLSFPQFGPWVFGPTDGFTRMVRWNIEKEPTKLKSKDIEAVFSLSDSDFTRSMWNYPFKILYKLVLLERELQLDLTVENVGNYFNFDFNFLIHTPLKVPNASECKIYGFQNSLFLDETVERNKNFRDKYTREENEFITVEKWTDVIYKETSDELTVTNVDLGNKMILQKENLPYTILWNPWKENVTKIDDFGNHEYIKMICFKSGHPKEKIKLLPGTSFNAKQNLKYIVPVNPKFDIEFPCPFDYYKNISKHVINKK